KECYHCHTTTTPLWRRDPKTHRTLCNACGLYLQQRHSQRPQQLIDADNDFGEESAGSMGGQEGPECSHCHTRQTSVWRRNKEGAQVCNACGVYQRLRGTERPLTLKKNNVKPR
ncbi:GATA zinc finger-domain-containing protein, partial [Mycena capillaripes]